MYVEKNGAGRYEVLIDSITLGSGETSIFDADGSAIVIHATADDNIADPVGNFGERSAQGPISRQRRPATGKPLPYPGIISASPRRSTSLAWSITSSHRRQADAPRQPTVASASRQSTNGRQHPSDQSPRRWVGCRRGQFAFKQRDLVRSQVFQERLDSSVVEPRHMPKARGNLNTFFGGHDLGLKPTLAGLLRMQEKANPSLPIRRRERNPTHLKR